MIVLEKISINEFDNKDYHNKDIKSENKAILTHYLHNFHNGVSEHYKESATDIFEDFVNYKQSCENISIHRDKALQKLLFEFAGIGGFRIALQNLGGKCVYTSEWDEKAKQTYQANFGEVPFGDITKESVKNYIPNDFDVLCAGFPCQPFSKGGFQNGFEDTRGTLFFDICQIIEKHRPRFLFLENVSNLVTHDNNNTYATILKHLGELDYYFPKKPLILSPDQFGMPILRPRIYIPCVRKDIARSDVKFIQNFEKQLEKYFTSDISSIDTIIDAKNTTQDLSDYELKVLHMWNDFYKNIDLKVIGFPVWADFFKYNGEYTEFADWKAKFVQKNVDLYQRNKVFIDKWLRKNKNLKWVNPTHRKFEWQAGTFHRDIFEGLIQFRPSGVRVKRATKFSTLVAMNHRQIIGKLKRKISLDEAKTLQSFPKEYKLNSLDSVALKQLGNAVNIDVVQLIFKLIKSKYYEK